MPRAASAGVVLKSLPAGVAGGKPTDRFAGAGPTPPFPPPKAATTATPTATMDTMGSAARIAHRLMPAADSGEGTAPSAVSPDVLGEETSARSRPRRVPPAPGRPSSPFLPSWPSRVSLGRRPPVSASSGRRGGTVRLPRGSPEPGNSNPGGPEPGGPAGEVMAGAEAYPLGRVR